KTPAGAAEAAIATTPQESIAASTAPTTGSVADAGTAVVLLGTGVVGGAFLKLLDTPAAANVRLAGVANSRCQQVDPEHLARRDLRRKLNAGTGDKRDNAALLDVLSSSGTTRSVIVDATASDHAASHHAE